MKAVLMALHQSVPWINYLLGQEEEQKRQAGMVLITSLMATALSQESFKSAATAIATELATFLNCDRVSLGFKKRHHIDVVAISHNADFNHQQDLVRAISAAMDESADQGISLIYPVPANALPSIAVTHGELASHHGSTQICTLPVTIPGKVIGAITLERRAEQPFAGETVALCTHLACLLAPILQLKHDRDRNLFEVMRDAFRVFLERLASKGINRTKLVVLSAAVIAILLALPFASYRVSAPARLEGAIQRALVAPVDGFVKQVHAQPGDLVKAGQVLAEMADEEINLERHKLESELAQFDSAYGAALATRDRAQVAISVARLEEARAKLALITQQMSRIQLKAPFDGVLIKGDLTQSLGAPVKRGEALMMVAPREGFRIILEVGDQDIRQIKLGQRGSLALSALPQGNMKFHVKRISPVAEARGGRNFFEVEAQLDQPAEKLRPGLEGVAKVDIDSRSLGWIWFHQAFDWLRFKTWTWLA
jgi:GAF domain-containing protein